MAIIDREILKEKHDLEGSTKGNSSSDASNWEVETWGTSHSLEICRGWKT